jgi:hypothetical protein
MSEAAFESAHLWFCDRTDLRHDLVRRAQERCGPRPVEAFASAEAARAYLRGPEAGHPFSPGILVSDWIGYGGAEPDQPAVAQLFRERYPLILTALFTSRLEEHAAEVERYRRLGLLDRPFQKSQMEELLATLQGWVERSERPFAQRFRAYIAALGDRAVAPYLNDGKGGWLSLAELYREVICDTQRGRKTEQVWDPLLGGRPEAAAVPAPRG